jgi:hypothetical protein
VGITRLAGTTATLQPEFATVRTATGVFGLSRTELWRLMDQNAIKWIHYKANPAAAKGVRLVDLASLRAYIQSFSK